MSDNYELIDVDHIPLHPPRPGTPGEGIYLALWQEWATANPDKWRAIFDTTEVIGQRAASVAASYMVYMGCNGGYSFTTEALRLAKLDSWRERAFLSAWAVKNKRARHVNSGLRTVEYMLAAEYPIPSGNLCHSVNWNLVPAITMHDTDVVESMVIWWSESTAAVMREIAEPMIAAAQRKLMSGMFVTQQATPESHPQR